MNTQEELEEKIYRDIENMTLNKGMDLRAQAKYYANIIASQVSAARREFADLLKLNNPDIVELVNNSLLKYEKMHDVPEIAR